MKDSVIGMRAICKSCKKEITIVKTGGCFYAMCRACCSLDEESPNYVYSHLGATEKKAVMQMINKGYAREVCGKKRI